MNNPIHNSIGMDTTTQTTMPIFFSILCAENGGCEVMPPLNEFKQEMLLTFGYIFK